MNLFTKLKFNKTAKMVKTKLKITSDKTVIFTKEKSRIALL